MAATDLLNRDNRAMIKVLGIDTSMRSSGVAIVGRKGAVTQALFYGIIKNPANRPHSACLEHIHTTILDIVDKEQPDCVAIEGIFFCKNVKTAIILGQARGAALAACAVNGLPIYEYAPRRVKQAITGNGTAQKYQMINMVSRLLALPEATLKDDEADALAIALCHLNCRNSITAETCKQI